MSYSDEVLADSPLGLWMLDETSGTTASDSSGNGRHGTYTNVTLGQGTLLSDGTGHAAGFPGTNTALGAGYVEVPQAAWMEVDALTVEAIIRPTGTGTYTIASRDTAQSSMAPRHFLLRAASQRLNASVHTITSEINLSNALLSANEIHHVAITWDSGTIKGYVDGVMTASAGTSGAINKTSGQPLRIGYINNVQFNVWDFLGRIQGVAYYGEALSDARIAAHAAAVFESAPPDPTGTLAATLPTPTASLDGTYAPPAVTGSMDAETPLPTVAMSGTYADPVEGTFALTLPTPTTALSGTYDGPVAGSLATALPTPAVALVGDYAPPTISGSFDLTLPVPTVALTGTAPEPESPYAAAVIAHDPDGYWRFDETGGTTLLDSSGNGHHGTYRYGSNHGRFTLGRPGAILSEPSSTALGLLDNAEARLADDAGASIAQAAWMERDTFTALIWFRTDGDGDKTPQLIGRFLNSDPLGLGAPWLLMLANGTLRGWVRTVGPSSSNNAWFLPDPIDYADGRWHMAALTYDGSEARLLFDATVIASAALSGPAVDGGARPIDIGWRSDATLTDDYGRTYPQVYGFPGDLDEAYFGPALSDADVLALYEMGQLGLSVRLPIPAVALVGDYEAPPTTGTLAVVLPSLVDAVVLHGEYDPPIATPPATYTPAVRVEKAIAYPAPDLVNGRAT